MIRDEGGFLMDIFEMTNHAMKLAEKHQDLELIALMKDLENGLKALQEQHSNENTKVYKPSALIDMEWGHYTSNND